MSHLGHVELGENGRGTLTLISDLLVEGEASSIIGRSVVLHEGTDDLTSQPTGCGVIETVNNY